MPTRRRALVTGATGLLGPYLVEEARRLGMEVDALGHRHGDRRCDLTDRAAVADLLDGGRYDLVVNAAALTDVDRCERAPALAEQLNAGIVANIVRALPRTAVLVQISTDQVYPDTTGPHGEGATGPVNAYGRSKLAGEQFAADHPRSLVVRTNLVGPSLRPHRSSLTDWALDALAGDGTVDGFTDAWFSPLHLRSAAAWSLVAADAGLTGPYNVASRGGLTKYEALRLLASLHGHDPDRVRPAESVGVRGRARRARDLRTDVRAVEAALGVAMPDLADELAAVASRHAVGLGTRRP